MNLRFATLTVVASGLGLLAITAAACSDDPAVAPASSSSSSSSSSSGGDAAPADDAGPIKVAVDRSKLYEAQCKHWADCIRPNYAECVADYKLQTENLAALPGAHEDTQAEIDACTAQYEALTSCDGRHDITCASSRGTLPDGAECASGTECTGGRCEGSTAARCGTCAKLAERPAPVPLGGDCNLGPLDCADGLTCFKQKCVAGLKTGATCDPKAIFECETPLRCVKGVCTAWTVNTAVGDPCDSGNAQWCSAALDCNVTTKKCEAKHEVGAPCTYDGGTPDCGPRLHCGTDGKCADDPPDAFPKCGDAGK